MIEKFALVVESLSDSQLQQLASLVLGEQAKRNLRKIDAIIVVGGDSMFDRQIREKLTLMVGHHAPEPVAAIVEKFRRDGTYLGHDLGGRDSTGYTIASTNNNRFDILESFSDSTFRFENLKFDRPSLHDYADQRANPRLFESLKPMLDGRQYDYENGNLQHCWHPRDVRRREPRYVLRPVHQPCWRVGRRNSITSKHRQFHGRKNSVPKVRGSLHRSHHRVRWGITGVGSQAPVRHNVLS